MIEKKALMQQHYQTSDQADSNKIHDGICSICKANFRDDRANQKMGDFENIAQDGMHPEADDSLLLDDFESNTPGRAKGD